jgi:hypothetical protein
MQPFNMSPGLMQSPTDNGAAPDLKGGQKDLQRRREHGADDRMHRGSTQASQSGIEKAMGAHADKLHPVGQRRKVRSVY